VLWYRENAGIQMLQAILSDKKRMETSVLAENKHSEVFCLVSATSESSESVFLKEGIPEAS